MSNKSITSPYQKSNKLSAAGARVERNSRVCSSQPCIRKNLTLLLRMSLFRMSLVSQGKFQGVNCSLYYISICFAAHCISSGSSGPSREVDR